MQIFDESVPALLSTEQTADLLGIKPHTLAVARSEKTRGLGELPYHKVGRSVRYRKADLEAFVLERRVAQ